MGMLNGGDHDIFRKTLGAAFHHHDGIGGAGHHEIQVAGLQAGQVRIDQELAIAAADSHRSDRPVERNVGDGKRRGCRDNAENI